MTKVVIVGAGIGGLCAAIGLRQAGCEVEVYERASEVEVVGAGLSLWSNAIKGLRDLGIEPEALEGARIQQGEILDWRGQVLSTMPAGVIERRQGAPTIATHRARLQKALLACLPAEVVHLGLSFTHFQQDEQGVTAFFADGQAAHGDVLVGADGIHSAVRKQLFPQVSLRYAGYTAWRGVLDPAEEIPLAQTSESWGRGARFGIVPIGAGQVYWFATANQPEGRLLAQAERQAFLREHFRGWHAPVEALIEATPEAQILQNDVYDFLPMIRWGQGRVTLLGDAAHATTPNLGQGACQAIESAVWLARCIMTQDGPLEEKLLRYERDRQPRTAWITNTSYQLGSVSQWQNRLACALRDRIVRLTPQRVTLGQFEKATDYLK